MQRLAGLVLAALLMILAVWIGVRRGAAPPRSVRVLVVSTDASVEILTRAIDRLGASDRALGRRVDFVLRAPSLKEAGTGLPPADLVLVELLDAAWVGGFEKALLDLAGRRGLARADRVPEVVGFGPAARSLSAERRAALGIRHDDRLDAYWTEGGPHNVEQLLRYALKRYGGMVELGIQAVEPRPQQGYVFWDAAGAPHLVSSFTEWQRGVGNTTRPRVAVLEFAARARQEVLAVPKALSDALAQAGVQPLVAFGQPGSKAVRELLLDEAGRPRADVIVSLHLRFADPQAADTLAQLGVPVLNAVRVHGRTLDEWRASTEGLSASEVAWQLAVPELYGLTAPTVVGATEARGSQLSSRPIPERVRRMAERAAALSRLRNTPAAERRIAFVYWNFPPGKENIGASYLNVLDSLPHIAADLARRGYDAGSPSAIERSALSAAIRSRGRNIGRWAPGELAQLVADGEVEAIPVRTYKEWFASLPEPFRKKVEAHWGPPERADIMALPIDGQPHLVIPVVRRGNLIFLPQPDRARTQDLDALYHSQDLPPHHQYIATYLWLQRTFQAHALVHMGTHGTLEWLSGKEAGLAGEDAGEVLTGSLPILYPYIVDDVGEGIVAKRRGAATVVDHLTPALGTSGLAPPLAALQRKITDWQQARATGQELAARIAVDIEAEADKRGLDRDLADKGWSAAARRAAPDPTGRIEALAEHLETIRAQSIPLGTHTFGVAPSGARLDGFAALIAAANPSPAGEARALDVARAALAQSGLAELAQLARGLEGGYVQAGPGNDPVRNLAALPTGKDFYAFDPRTVPTEAAERLGQKLAARLVQDFRAKNEAWPDRLAFEVWGVETIRHAGVQEAQALALLGVAIRRDAQGRFLKLERVPREQLGRPRVDVVFHTTGLYRDTFPMLIELLDQAVRLAAESPEPDNAVARHTADLTEKLIAQGIKPDVARQRARVRIFAEPPGMHDSKVAALADASGSWDREGDVADVYIRRMGFGYGNGLWGAEMEAEFRAALAGTQAIVHSRSSRLYGTLDNDDFFAFGGSIALGVRRVQGGKSPPMWVAELSTPGAEKHVAIEELVGAELRSRVLNPTYAAAMRDEGYAGLREVWKSVEYLWGWQVVYPEAVAEADWQEVYDVWVADRERLGLAKAFEKASPFARQGIAARLLETARKGYWSPPQQTLAGLSKALIDGVVNNGVGCDSLTCNNPELRKYAEEQARRTGAVPASTLLAWSARLEKATGKALAGALSERARDKQRWLAPPAPTGSKEAGRNGQAARVKGYKMEESRRTLDSRLQPLSAPALPRAIWILWLCVLAGALRRWRELRQVVR